jgi:hypothetical protein
MSKGEYHKEGVGIKGENSKVYDPLFKMYCKYVGLQKIINFLFVWDFATIGTYFDMYTVQWYRALSVLYIIN